MSPAEHIMSWNQLLLGIFTLLTTAGGILALVRKWIVRARQQMQTDLHNILEKTGDLLLRKFENVPEETYLTLDFRQQDGSRELFIPLHKTIISEPLTGLLLRLIAQKKDVTLYEIDTTNHPIPVRIPWHHHDGTESVHVVEGHILDVATGRLYRAGETWEIPPGTNHITEFNQAFCVARMRPALPTAKTRPMKLDGIVSIYDREPTAA